MPLEVEIPVKEVQRYMGYHGIVDIAPEISEKINKAIEHLGTQSHPRIISKEYRILSRRRRSRFTRKTKMSPLNPKVS